MERRVNTSGFSGFVWRIWPQTTWEVLPPAQQFRRTIFAATAPLWHRMAILGLGLCQTTLILVERMSYGQKDSKTMAKSPEAWKTLISDAAARQECQSTNNIQLPTINIINNQHPITSNFTMMSGRSKISWLSFILVDPRVTLGDHGAQDEYLGLPHGQDWG